MTDTTDVLQLLKVVYTLYALAIISLFAWFGRGLVSAHKPRGIVRIPFYGYAASLVVVGVFLHVLTFQTIPWVEHDLKRHTIRPDKTFDISVRDHAFRLPSERMVIDCHDKVLFRVTSSDLTYGFGLFRPDHTMLFQMQVNPGPTPNTLLWAFHRDGTYTLRSTEYSGPRGAEMVVRDAVEVRGCASGPSRVASRR